MQCPLVHQNPQTLDFPGFFMREKWTSFGGVVHQNPLSLVFPAFLFQEKWTDSGRVVHLTGTDFERKPDTLKKCIVLRRGKKIIVNCSLIIVDCSLIRV